MPTEQSEEIRREILRDSGEATNTDEIERPSRSDIFEGSKQLLLEVLQLQGNAVADTLIVGGWGPYLRNQTCHPGTRDVDILFPINYTKADIGIVVRRFLEHNYLLSAKHDFQLFRTMQIGKHNYVFNVDLLHPAIERVNRAEYMDILDLDVTVEGILAKKFRTICFELGEVIFNQKLFTDTEYGGLRFRTLSAAGVVLSKLNACHNPKRPRDIFDIYLSLKEPGDVVGKIKELGCDPEVASALTEYKHKLGKNWDSFYSKSLSDFKINADENVRQVLMSIVDD